MSQYVTEMSRECPKVSRECRGGVTGVSQRCRKMSQGCHRMSRVSPPTGPQRRLPGTHVLSLPQGVSRNHICWPQRQRRNVDSSIPFSTMPHVVFRRTQSSILGSIRLKEFGHRRDRTAPRSRRTVRTAPRSRRAVSTAPRSRGAVLHRQDGAAQPSRRHAQPSRRHRASR